MAKNKIITSEGNIQFQFPDGKILNIDPKNVYSVYNTNTVNFILISAMKNSGLAFMSSTAEDLELNGQTYTFAQLPDAIAEAFSDAGASFHAEVVDELPASGKSNTIYLVPKESSASTEIDEFDEYIWLKDEQEWEMIGTTSIDMSNINALSGQVQTLSGEVITLSGEVSANTANISTLSGDVASISGDVSSISGDVQSMSGDIASISGDVATVSGQVSANTANISALSGDVNSLSGEVQTISGDVQSLSGDIASISGDVATVSGSVSSLSGEVVTLSGEVSANTANISTLSGNVATVSGQVDAVSGQVSSLSGSVIENEEITAAALNQLNDDVLAVSATTSGKVDTSAITSSVTSASTDTEIPTAKAVYDAIPTGGSASYSAGRGIDITNDTISFNLPISADTHNNFIYGGTNNVLKNDANSGYNLIFGKSNTIDKYGMNLAYLCQYNTIFGEYNKLFVDSNPKQLFSCSIFGRYNTISASSNSIFSSFALGESNKGNNSYQTLFGFNNKATNMFEHTSGQYNVSSNASATFGDSGNTLFSVGNGTADNARHNAFEIRQNGDIYITSGGTDIKLQDNLGSTIEVSSAITSGDTNAVQGGAVYDKFNEVEQVAARAIVDLNSKFDGLKLKKITQDDYDALQTKDPNTLYVIVN